MRDARLMRLIGAFDRSLLCALQRSITALMLLSVACKMVAVVFVAFGLHKYRAGGLFGRQKKLIMFAFFPVSFSII